MSKTHRVELISGHSLTLPIVDIDKGLAISLLMCNNESYGVVDSLVSDLIEMLGTYTPDAIIGIPEQGIPLVHGVGRKLGLNRSFLFRKTPKAFDTNSLTVKYISVTKTEPQSLYLAREDALALKGKRVAIIEDVINTGSTIEAALWLLRKAGVADIQIFVVLTEGHKWEVTLGNDVNRVSTLGHIPMFKPTTYEQVE